MPLITPTGQPLPIQPGDFKGAGAPNRVTFGLDRVAPPSPLYIQRDDIITVQIITAGGVGTFVVSGRLLDPDGKVQVFQQSLLNTAAAFTQQQFQLPLMEGFLLGISVACVNQVARGSAFARIYIARGAATVPTAAICQLLASDYCSATFPVAWPAGRIVQGFEGYGLPVPKAIGNPAAGAQFSFTQTVGTVQTRMLHAQATLTTSATVANRLVSMQIQDAGAVAPIEAVASAVQAASLAITYHWFIGAQPQLVNNAKATIPLPALLSVFTIGSFSSVVQNMQAGDQWSAISMMLETWLAI